MKSWLIGFVIFGVAYAVIVGAIAFYTWPTIADISRARLDHALPFEQRSQIVSVELNPGEISVRTDRYDLSASETEGDGVTVVRVFNGHDLILVPQVPEEVAHQIGADYAALVDEYLIEAKVSQIERLLVALVVPLATFVLFAWLARVLWRKLMLLE